MHPTIRPQPKSSALDRYLATARNLGCPPDQLRAFRACGYAPQVAQLRFHAACRAADLPGGPTRLGFGGARGGGKSHAILAQIGCDDCQRLPGAKWLLLRKVGHAAKEGFEDFLLRSFAPWMRYWIPSRNVLAFPNGSRIIIGHFQSERDVDSYLGLEYDGIAIEEATQLSRAKLEMIATVNRTSKSNWRPRMYYSWNPGGVGHQYVKQLFADPYRRNAQTDTRFIPGTVHDNKHVNPEYRRTLEQLTGWRRAAWLDGDMDIAAGQFFTNWRHALHVRSGAFAIPNSARVWCALDYGFTHYTVVYLLCLYDGMITVLDEHAERRWLPPRHSDAMKAMLNRWELRLSDLASFVAGRDVFAVGKDSQGKTIADQYEAQGIVLTAADDSRINGAGELLSLLGDAEAGIPPRIEILERCARLIACIPAMEHDPHRPEDVLKVDTDDNGDGGDDFFDSLRYGIMDVQRHAPITIPAGVILSSQLFGGHS
jgi:phage terminase large subunit